MSDNLTLKKIIEDATNTTEAKEALEKLEAANKAANDNKSPYTSLKEAASSVFAEITKVSSNSNNNDDGVPQKEYTYAESHRNRIPDPIPVNYDESRDDDQFVP